MSQLLKQGFHYTKSHFNVLLLLFLYQAIWGFFLYRMIDHVLTPIYLRYPKITANNELIQLFWIENQFRITKTDLLTPYLFTFIGLLLLKMLITPFLQSGLFSSLFTMSQGELRTSFIKGVKETWKPMLLQYWTKSLLILLPLVWFINIQIKADHSIIFAIHDRPLSLWISYFVWALLITALFYVVQLGIGAKLSPIKAISTLLKHFIKLTTIALTLFIIFIVISLSVHALSIFWVTFTSFLLYQLLPLIRTLFKMWTIAAQYSSINKQQA